VMLYLLVACIGASAHFLSILDAPALVVVGLVWMLVHVVVLLTVAKIILHPRLPISPCLVTIDARELPQVSQATLANAITLTPGTLTTDIDRGRIEVHCLTRAMADQVSDGENLRRARQLTER
ncbi:MAG: DUF819 family protein, partial [Xanthomonadales bacterium]|nr:DUF819 family protein [Xanthomonadales bacterium]